MKLFNKLPKTPQGMKLKEAAKQRQRERIRNEYLINFDGSFANMTDKERINHRITIKKIKGLWN